MSALAWLEFKENYHHFVADCHLVHGADIVRDFWPISSNYSLQILPSRYGHVNIIAKPITKGVLLQ